GALLSWQNEIWPMQWRLGCSGLVNYFAFSLFNPVMFHYHGAVVAGRMGMTLQIVNGIQTVAMIWLKARVPAFGKMIAQREYARLDRSWLKTAFLSLGSFIIMGSFFCLFLALIQHWGMPFSERILPVASVGIFVAGGIFMNISQSLTAYLRAHKQEPIFILGVTTSLLIGLLVWHLGRSFGPQGAAWGYLGVMIISVVWETRIWQRCRRIWHAA
ncbi:MAG: hypothetical protein AAB276_07340, partial [Pseudomonadota bacterium]